MSIVGETKIPLLVGQVTLECQRCGARGTSSPCARCVAIEQRTRPCMPKVKP